MAFLEFKNVKITGLSVAVPKKISIINDKTIETSKYSAEEYSASVGVYQRRVSDTLTTGDLCYWAAEKLISDLSWDKSGIEAIVFVSLSPDYMQPATAGIIQDRLGLTKECFAEDILLGCSGWVYGLCNAASLVSSGCIKKVLLMAGDAKFRAKHPLDPLFGFAGTVTALEYDESATPVRFHMGTDGSGYDALIIPDGGARNQLSESSFKIDNVDGKLMHRVQSRMKGMDVFSFGITTVPKSFKKFCEHFNITLDNFDYYVLHQANKKMNDAIVKKLRLDSKKVPYSLHDYANTSSASIPLTIVTELKDACSISNQNILCCGFGIGLSWGTASFVIGPQCCISDLIEVEEDGDDKVHII
ncbi:MAG: ketoacyl-ACP synthase III [Bacteroidia bacterium]|nr:ketoacyl-ACP synthase III [Bacteroidia bacterium]